jgi:hypothetical protein
MPIADTIRFYFGIVTDRLWSTHRRFIGLSTDAATTFNNPTTESSSTQPANSTSPIQRSRRN